MKCNLFQSDLLDNLKSLDKEKIIFVEKGKSYTVGTLLDKSEKLAINLIKNGFGNHERVVLAIAPSYELIVSVFALMQLNSVIALIDPEMGKENYQSKIDQFQPTWAFVDSRLLFLNEHPIIKHLYQKYNKNPLSFPTNNFCKIVKTGMNLPLYRQYLTLNKLLDEKNIEINFITANVNEPFMITYTSGTLSEPKGVVHSIKTISESIFSLRSLLKSEDTKLASHLPHFILLGVILGIETYLIPQNISTNAKVELIKNNEITTLFAPPVEYQELVQYCIENQTKLPNSLRHLFFGSAPVYPKFLQKIIGFVEDNVLLTCLYGMTENLLVCAIDGREKATYTGEGDIVGKPLKDVSIRIVDDEIELSSPQLFLGYFSLSKSDAFHNTGDLGKINSDGNIILLGRKKDMIIRRNTNIYPGLYEPTIAKINGVDEVAMVGIYDEIINDEKVILVVDGSISKSKLISELKSGIYSIDNEAFPDEIIFMKIPKSGRQNKTDKKLLRNLLYEN